MNYRAIFHVKSGDIVASIHNADHLSLWIRDAMAVMHPGERFTVSADVEFPLVRVVYARSEAEPNTVKQTYQKRSAATGEWSLLSHGEMYSIPNVFDALLAHAEEHAAAAG